MRQVLFMGESTNDASPGAEMQLQTSLYEPEGVYFLQKGGGHTMANGIHLSLDQAIELHFALGCHIAEYGIPLEEG